ncbi:MAG TPA: trypsin-like peptidase domain-containing protein [Isosphaeraceae bacterium]|jgi:hypothetical protein|nr:trypsin-like peptidase domain-containing protein [Isosphaeraceae bacterium]
MRPARLVPLTLALLATTARGQEAIPLKTVAEIKGATVYIKTSVGPVEASGSGFVMRVEGGAAFVVTNHHVVTPPERLTRGRAAVITAVFGSGTKAERSARAEVLASDPDRDLALLKVEGVKDLPRPIDFGAEPELTETMPVFTFGFPFGAALATSKGSPAITVGRGSVSSLRTDDRGKVVVIQIDGALNPGNSGGPVVDAKGRLIGIAVATIKGAQQIGFVIPRGELVGLLDGRVGGATTSLRKLAGTALEFDIEARLIDPVGQIKLVSALYLPGDKTRSHKAAADGAWPPLAGAKEVALKVADQKATGTVALTLAHSTDRLVTFQLAYVNGRGKRIYVQPGLFNAAGGNGERSSPSPKRAAPAEVAAGRPPRRGRAPRPTEVGVEVAPGDPCRRIEQFLSAAVDPKSKVALTAGLDGFLRHYSYPDFELQGSYKLDGQGYHAALDAPKGLLYLVVAEPNALDYHHPSHHPTGRANLHAYDVAAILAGKGEPGTALEPAAVVPLGGSVWRFATTPDGRYLFALIRSPKANIANDRASRGGEKLIRIDAARRKADMELDLVEGSDALCLAPDGKTLYVTASPKGHSAYNTGPLEGHIQVINPETVEVSRTIIVPADPCDVQAGDRGILFLSGGSNQHTVLSVVDTRKSRSIIARWPGTYNGGSIQITADRSRLYFATQGLSPASVASWRIPKDFSGPAPKLEHVETGSARIGGDFFLTPDGRFLLHRWGAVVSLDPDATRKAPSGKPRPAGDPGPSGPGRAKGSTSKPGRPRRLD